GARRVPRKQQRQADGTSRTELHALGARQMPHGHAWSTSSPLERSVAPSALVGWLLRLSTDDAPQARPSVTTSCSSAGTYSEIRSCRLSTASPSELRTSGRRACITTSDRGT